MKNEEAKATSCPLCGGPSHPHVPEFQTAPILVGCLRAMNQRIANLDEEAQNTRQVIDGLGVAAQEVAIQVDPSSELVKTLAELVTRVTALEKSPPFWLKDTLGRLERVEAAVRRGLDAERKAGQ